MKINPLYSLLALGIALITTPGEAQTTPAGTVSSTTRPQGAVAPDSGTTSQSARMQKRAMKRNRKTQRTNARDTSTSTSVQNARYRESSASGGTSVNNSNVTNYNSNNVMNAPTGVGSNPNTDKALQVQTESTGAKTGTGTTTGNADAGAVEAIKGAKTAGTPAVKSGSTVRNTSIGDFIASSPNYITLQNALQSSDLFDALKANGPYTLFAPTNDAFKKLPTSVQGGLLDGSNRDALKQLLSGHVVSGSMNSDDLTQKIKAGGGKAQLKTLSGSTLTAQLGSAGRIQLTDEQGGVAHVEDTGSRQQNGIVYGVDAVLLTKQGASAFK